MKHIDEQYQDLLREIMKAPKKENRTGISTYAIACWSIRHDMADWFPLLTTKKMPIKMIAAELEWFIKGISSKKWFQERKCSIRDERCNPQKVSYAHDEETKAKMKAEDDLWRIYGVQRRDRMGKIDQLKEVVEKLKTNPFDRRMIVNAWNSSELDQMALPPCHYSYQIIVTLNNEWEKVLNLTWNQRSVDTPLGLPFNIASYAMLLLLLAKESDMIPGILMWSLGDVHIYENQIEWVKEQLTREPMKLPTLEINNWKNIWEWEYTDIELVWYESHPRIDFPIAV